MVSLLEINLLLGYPNLLIYIFTDLYILKHVWIIGNNIEDVIDELGANSPACLGSPDSIILRSRIYGGTEY